MAVPETITKLIERFDFHRQSHISSRDVYNETKLRQDYLDHVFIALGWDVYNTQGWSEQAREVSLEQPIKILGTTDFIDYSFKIGKDLKFIAEAKAPRVRIKDNTNAAYQVRRYAWNATLSLCLLTNFDEFAVYDCTKRPSSSDAAVVARIEYFTYKDLPAKWDCLVSVFSKDAVFRGSFDRFAESTKGKKGTATVDDDILTEIENWRDALAKNIALRNTSLTVEELNYSVQTIIDRIIFLRICEDRGLEPKETLKVLLDTDDVYLHLCDLFRRADTKYNSGIFYFQKEPDREEPDTLTLSLKVDDKVIKGIIRRLYYPESPYEFSVIPTAILGHVYEQFLGKIIRLTEGHQARVEYKPEVKKAGGVFYTPQYIVEYIVRHTVEELVKGKTPGEVSQIRVLDPACGSGSFLLGAYQSLLDWHLEWYIQNLAPLLNMKVPVTDAKVQALLPEPIPKKKKSPMPPELPIYPTGYSNGIKKLDRTRSDWALSTTEKKRILLNNIFGVDIDHQAVEVTKLSLLLKVLEGENEENINKQLKLFAERALPSLHQNIKCGNSLIGTDILTLEMPVEEVKRINPFDWEREFADIMKAGGFDMVIGNPPYIRIHNIDKQSLKYYFEKFDTAEKKCDIYAFFTECVLKKLLKRNGLLGYIISNTWLNLDSFTSMRKIVVKNNKLLQIVTLDNPFSKVTVTPIIFFVQRNDDKDYLFSVSHFDIKTKEIVSNHIISSQSIIPPSYIIDLTLTAKSIQINQKMIEKSVQLDSISILQYGIMTADNEKFVVALQKDANHKPLLSGEDIARYQINWHGKRFVDYRPNEMKKKETARPGEPERFEQPEKIVFQRYSSTKLIATLDIKKFYTLGTTIIARSKSDYSNKYLLGIINSRLLSWWYGRAYTSPTNYIREFEQLPIRTINFSDPVDKARHDKMVALVTQMLDLNKKLQDAKLEHEKTLLSRQIEATDASIDKLVYELYGLTEEEIKIVERN